MAYLLAGAEVVRERRVVTPDGRVWHVRRRWAKRQLPWKRRPTYELSPAERDTVPLLDAGEVLDSFGNFIRFDLELGLAVVVVILALVGLGLGALVAVTWDLVVPLVAHYAEPIAAVLAAAAVLLVLDRLTRPWFIEAESARLVDAPRRIWRVQGWWRARRAFRAVAAAIADGRVDAEHGAVLFDRSQAP